MQITNEAPEPGLEPFIPKFIEDRLSEISTMLVEKDLKNIHATAHQWKGFSRPYGFSKLEDFAIEIEKSHLEASLKILETAQEYCKKRAEIL